MNASSNNDKEEVKEDFLARLEATKKGQPSQDGLKDNKDERRNQIWPSGNEIHS
jgi:hypothetical protein